MCKKSLFTSFFGLIAALSASFVSAQKPALSVQVLKTFSYSTPPYVLDGANGINSHGDIVCSFLNNAIPYIAGTVYRPLNGAGMFLPPFNDPAQTGFFTSPSGINDSLVICGSYDSDDGSEHGFFESAGVFTTYDAPVENVFDTIINGENNLGDFVGWSANPDSYTGFAVIGGQFIPVSIDGASFSFPTGINDLDQEVGYYELAGTTILHGFLRDADGTLTYPIDYPGAIDTIPEAINNAGLIVGYWTDQGGDHGLILQLPDTFASFDVPRSKGKDTTFAGVNNSGIISGNYTGRARADYGLIARVVSDHSSAGDGIGVRLATPGYGSSVDAANR